MRIKRILLCVSVALVMLFASACDRKTPGVTDSDDQNNPIEGEAGMEIYWKTHGDSGIHVTAEGQMTLGGKPLYLAGVNCYNLYNQCLEKNKVGSVTVAKATLDVLKSYDVKAIRFNCGNFDHTGIAFYKAHREECLRLLAEIADYAEELQIGLIPSLFWLDRAVPDYFDEPIRAWGDQNSKTVAFMREYTKDIVNYLKSYKSIFGWEFGNEFNLGCDLPNAEEHLPPLPSHSTRPSRNEQDYLSATDAAYVMGEFADLVKNLDPNNRLVTSGNASLRPSQYHQLHENSWEQDNKAQYAQMTAMYTPENMNTVSEHVYFTEQRTFDQMLSLDEYLAYITATAKQIKKAYLIGEWGSDSESDITYYRNIARSIFNAGVQMSLFWNFNFVEGTIEHSFSAETTRGKEVLNLVKEMNGWYEEKY